MVYCYFIAQILKEREEYDQWKYRRKNINEQERKARTYRLITRRPILESLIENAEEHVGKTLLAIVNLPPRKMMGIDSEGMIISAIHQEEGEEKLNLVILSNRIPAGAKMY